VLARSPEGYTQIITSTGITIDELRQIAGGMQRVPGLLPTPTASLEAHEDELLSLILSQLQKRQVRLPGFYAGIHAKECRTCASLLL
jgi:hypothetical protein